MNVKVKEQEGDTTRTAAEPVVAAHASRDDPAPDKLVVTPDAVEIIEEVVIEDEKPIDDDDIRGQIYKKHSEKQTKEAEESAAQFGENSDLGVENTGTDVIIDETGKTSTPPDDDLYVDINVFGKVRQVLKAKVDEAGGVQVYQLKEAAYEQMRQNKQISDDNVSRQKSLDERERQIGLKEAVVPTLDQQEAKDTKPDRSTPTDDQSLEKMAQIYQDAVLDDDENAPSILADMVRQSAQTGEKFDKDAFRQEVKDEIAFDQRQSKVFKARDALIENNPELNKKDKRFDPRLFTAIDDETTIIDRQHPNWEPAEVIAEALKRVNKWKGVKVDESMSDKQNLKRKMNTPKVGNQRFATPPPPPVETSSDYVTKLRKSRGQEI